MIHRDLAYLWLFPNVGGCLADRWGVVAFCRVFVVVVLLVVGSGGSVGAQGEGFLGALNAERVGGGLPPLIADPGMGLAAGQWVDVLVARGGLSHADNFWVGAPEGWVKVGENVGRGRTVESLTAAFMRSPLHRANIMDPDFTHIGVAVAVGPVDGKLYTVHRFAATTPPPTAVFGPPPSTIPHAKLATVDAKLASKPAKFVNQ